MLKEAIVTDASGERKVLLNTESLNPEIDKLPLTKVSDGVPNEIKITTKLLGEEKEPRLWTLYYRYGNVPQMVKSFAYDGSLQQAVIRARKHCDILNIRFICVRPLLVDLDYQEKAFLEGKYREGSEF